MSTETTLRSPASLCKIAILVLGIVLMGVGLHSHFESVWRKNRLYQMCEGPVELKNCPSISLEQYFVAMVIITFLMSILGLVALFFIDKTQNPQIFKMADMGYHGAAALLLLIAAIVYMVSASQIKKLLGDVADKNIKLLRTEKIAAGVLTIFQGILFGVTALLVARQ